MKANSFYTKILEMFGLGYWHINWTTSKQVWLRTMLQMLHIYEPIFRCGWFIYLYFAVRFSLLFFLSSWVHTTWIMQCNRRVYRNSMQSKWVSLCSITVCQTRFHFTGFRQLIFGVVMISAFCSSMREFFCIFSALTLSFTQSGLSPADSERIEHTITVIWHPEAQVIGYILIHF